MFLNQSSRIFYYTLGKNRYIQNNLLSISSNNELEVPSDDDHHSFVSILHQRKKSDRPQHSTHKATQFSNSMSLPKMTIPKKSMTYDQKRSISFHKLEPTKMKTMPSSVNTPRENPSIKSSPQLFFSLPSQMKSSETNMSEYIRMDNDNKQGPNQHLNSPIHDQSKHMVSNLLGKSIPSHLHQSIHLHCLPSKLEREIQKFHYIDIPQIIHNLLHYTKQQPLQPHPWKFERTKEAATHNSIIIEKFEFDLDTATQNPPNTILSYGSEFKPTSAIQPILQYHPYKDAIINSINNGISYPLHPIDEQSRLADIDFMIERGNHKSAQSPENQQAIIKAFDKEVSNCWMIPLPIHIVKLIPNASITPLGVAT